MTASSQAIRARTEAEASATAERVGPGALTPTAVHPELRAAENPIINISAELRKAALLTANSRARRVRPVYAVTKRAFDLVVGFILLIIATPIILTAAAIIRLESKGSPFFVQTRLGKNGRPFKIVKLRGMFKDARIRFPSYYDYSCKRDLDFCFHHEVDPRVTRAGNFIRKTSIDELPNLWNVVLGDISLVGPRPEIPEVMALYGPYRDEYLSVKPGVTCLSKCTGRDRLTKRETIEYDLDYIRKRNFRVDLQILWRTFRGVLLRRDVF